MTSKELLHQYWRQYIMLEKELALTETYVAIDDSNAETFSSAYAKLLLQIGSEVDIATKVLCQMLDPTSTGDNISKYKGCILPVLADFDSVQVEVKNNSIVLDPWKDWNTQSPSWWTVYNKVKHERTSRGSIDGKTQEYFRYANQIHTLSALAGLYQILIYAYYYITGKKGEVTRVPMPGSRMFRLKGSIWDSVQFHEDGYFELIDGHLHYFSSEFPY